MCVPSALFEEGSIYAVALVPHGNLSMRKGFAYGVVVDKWITVRESDSDVDMNVLLKNGDWVDVSAGGSVWAGVRFTGESGPPRVGKQLESWGETPHLRAHHRSASSDKQRRMAYC